MNEFLEIVAVIGFVNAFYIAIGEPDIDTLNFNDAIFSFYSRFLYNKFNKKNYILKPFGYCFFCFGTWVGFLYFVAYKQDLLSFGVYLSIIYMYGKFRKI